MENAVEHGFKQTMGTLNVSLRVALEADILAVTVCNNGLPLPRDFQTLLCGEHALGNIDKRLRLLFQSGLEHSFEKGYHAFSFHIDLELMQSVYESVNQPFDAETAGEEDPKGRSGTFHKKYT